MVELGRLGEIEINVFNYFYVYFYVYPVVWNYIWLFLYRCGGDLPEGVTCRD